MKYRIYPYNCGNCKNCNKIIWAKNSGFVRKDRKFCSGSCRASFNNKNNNPSKLAHVKALLSKSAKLRFSKIKKTDAHIEKMRLANLGSKSHFWRGGLTEENRLLRNSVMSKQWRELVFERDNYTCQICGDRSVKNNPVLLEADHIKPWSQYPELRFEVSNGRTLCKPCHRNTPTFGRKYTNGRYQGQTSIEL